MTELGDLTRVELRTVWPNEASDFTPWLANNLDALGATLGRDLELLDQEAAVGDFSLDILARDVGSGSNVVIENQLTVTDHDHLGKLLTYASGHDAGMVVWVAQSVRDEHRQAIDWLNQRTDSETNFFAVVLELISVDGSRPAHNFRLVAAPNDWRKQQRAQARGASRKEEAYREFFQSLIDELREQHKFTNAKIGQPQNWHAFSSGISGINYGAVFAQGGRIRAELYIDQGDAAANASIFDRLLADKDAIESEFGQALEWERLDNRRACRVGAYRDGQINTSPDELAEIQSWLVERLLKMRDVFGGRVRELV